MKNILVIDDEVQICESIKMILEYEDYFVDYTTDPNQGLKKIEYLQPDAILLDIQMDGLNGFEILDRMKEEEYYIPVIMISAFSSLENAVKATKLGAFDFIEKPIDRDKLIISVRNAAQQSNLKKENSELKKVLEFENEIIGESDTIKLILATIDKVAQTEARVMITGENGTGKELVARAIHRKSNRAEYDLIEVNCAAIPTELIESELFGHEKGSFTGALQQRIGKFEKSHKGTLFLDEIGDMSLQAQAKVLKAIEDNKIERVGGNNSIDIDVRIISATNKSLEEEIEENNFREDLFHRLNVIPIHIPPLRERAGDIPILAKHFLQDMSKKNNIGEKVFNRSALELMSKQPWKGNVRELKNFVERLVIMSMNPEISEKDVQQFLPGRAQVKNDLLDTTNSFQEFKEKAEKAFIEKQLDVNSWNISKTAEILGIQRSHLYGKMKKYNIEKGN